MTMNRVLTAALLLLMLALPAFAQDRDGDGLPDAVEVKLGTNPDLDEGLQVVIDDGLRGQTDKSGRGPTAPDVDKVYFAHVAGDRYVWKVTFGADYPTKDVVFHLYTDLDDDKTTGRQEADWVRGVDVMYSAVDARTDPRIINPAPRVNAAIPVRMVFEGNTLYIADDVHIKAVDGKTHFRMYVLSHIASKPSDSDTADWVYASVPLHPERVLPKSPFATPENSEGLYMSDFPQLTYGLWQDPQNVRLKAGDATVEGYTLLMSDDFDGAGSVSWKSPISGQYRVGLVLHDDASRPEALEVLVNGRKVSTIVGSSPSSRDVLYYTAEPVAITAGQTIEARTAENGGTARFLNVCLLASKPQAPNLVIENLAAWHLPDVPGEPAGRVMVAWTTNRPTEATVHYALAGPEAFEQSGDLSENRGFTNNHFIYLPPELRASAYQLTITCKEAPQTTYTAQTATASYRVWRNAAAHRRNELRLDTDRPRTTQRITLTVHEPTYQPRADWPVTSGVPLPDGTVDDPAQCRLLDSKGAVVPAQFKVTSRWPSGDIRWLLVDFLANTRTAQEATYVLECPVAATEAKPGVTVTPAASNGATVGQPLSVLTAPVTVDTGALALQIGAGGFAPFAQVSVAGKPVSAGDPKTCGFEITDAQGVVYSSALAPPEQILLEDAGPVRTTLCIKGRLVSATGAGFMRYVCRLSFWAGQSFVKTSFCLDNDVTTADMSLFQGVQVRIPAALAGAQLTCGGDGKVLPLKLGERLLQDEDNRFTAGETAGKRSNGWILARGQQSLAVAIRDFWQLYPKGLSADDKGLTVELHPKLSADQYAGASDDDLNKLYFWCDKGRYKVRQGVRLNTEFAVDYLASRLSAAGGQYTAGLFWQKPVFAACDPTWYCASGAFGPMFPRTPGKFDGYENTLDNAFGQFMQRREQIREYGFMNYGDWFGERTWNWGNGEYDTQWAMAANFARTGNLGMLWRAEQMERHKADVDTVHYWSNPSNIGAEYEHCTGHTGGYFDQSWKDMGWFNTGPHDSGHSYCQGHAYVYALTGDPRFLETADSIAQWLSARTTDFRYGAERQAGWAMTGLMGVFNITGNPTYLNASKLIADTMIWTQHPDRGIWGHWQDPNECKHTPRCWGCKAFMTGVLLHGLKMYDLAQPREDLRAAYIKGCDAQWREMYVRADKGFAYSQCKTFQTKGGAWTVSLNGDGLAYGCRIDPKHANKDLLLDATGMFMYRGGLSAFGKTFTQFTCFMPWMLYELDALGLGDAPELTFGPELERAEMRSHVYLAPGETRQVYPLIARAGSKSVTCKLSVTGDAPTWLQLPKQAQWEAPVGTTFGPAVEVRVPQNAADGTVYTASLTLQRGADSRTSLPLTVTVVAPQKLGDRIGWVTGEGDPLLQAAEALGVKPEVIADLSALSDSDLLRYRTLIVGDEAFTKDFGKVRAAAGRLERWVAAGGKLIVGQLNDDQWSPTFLPLDLVVSDTDDRTGAIKVPGHPLFNTPNQIQDLSEVTSYDTVALAAPNWKTLASTLNGSPAILQAKVGTGEVLVVNPSFDRPVADPGSQDAAKREACTKLIRNLLVYAGYPA